MATTPLVITDPVISIDDTDFSDAVTKAIIRADANEVEIPATFATPISSRRGSVKYSLELEYFSNDTDATAELFSHLFDAVTDADGDAQLDFTVKWRNAAVSATNPEWSGTIVVLATAIGGQAGSLSSDSQTFPMTGKPSKATS